MLLSTVARACPRTILIILRLIKFEACDQMNGHMLHSPGQGGDRPGKNKKLGKNEHIEIVYKNLATRPDGVVIEMVKIQRTQLKKEI